MKPAPPRAGHNPASAVCYILLADESSVAHRHRWGGRVAWGGIRGEIRGEIREIRDNDPLPSVKCSEIVPQCAPETPNVLGTYGQIA